MMPFVPWTRSAAALAAGDTAALLQRLARGDVGALDSLYRREAAAVYRYALALSGDAAAAADATHDAFMALAARPLGFDAGLGDLGAYLAGIARHALLRQRRLAGVPLDDEILESQGFEVQTAQSPETLKGLRQSRDALWTAIRALPWVQQEALVLVDLQERSYEQAARIAGCPLNTLRTRLHRARQSLGAALGAAIRECVHE